MVLVKVNLKMGIFIKDNLNLAKYKVKDKCSFWTALIIMDFLIMECLMVLVNCKANKKYI